MSKYSEISNNTALSDSAKERILNNVSRSVKQKTRTKFGFSNRIIKFATVCAAALIVCGTAIGTGVYYGTHGGDDGGPGELNDGGVGPRIEPYDTYSTAYEYVDTEYDLDNVKIKVYYSLDEETVRKRYNEVVSFGKEIRKNGENEIIDYSIYLRATVGGGDYYRDYFAIAEAEGGNLVYDFSVFNKVDPPNEFDDKYNTHLLCHSVVLDRITIDDIDNFPFEDYAMTEVIEKDENGNDRVVERTYAHSIEVTLPRELFEGNVGGILLQMHDVTEYKYPQDCLIGSQKDLPSDSLYATKTTYGFDEFIFQSSRGGIEWYGSYKRGTIKFGSGGESMILYNKTENDKVLLTDKSIAVTVDDPDGTTNHMPRMITLFNRSYYTHWSGETYTDYIYVDEEFLFNENNYPITVDEDYVNSRKPISR